MLLRNGLFDAILQRWHVQLVVFGFHQFSSAVPSRPTSLCSIAAGIVPETTYLKVLLSYDKSSSYRVGRGI
jgi:hypothetical protein